MQLLSGYRKILSDGTCNRRGTQDRFHIKLRGIAYKSRWRRDRGHEALQERLTRLSEASLSINESLDFDEVLQGALDAGRSRTAARYECLVPEVHVGDGIQFGLRQLRRGRQHQVRRRRAVLVDCHVESVRQGSPDFGRDGCLRVGDEPRAEFAVLLRLAQNPGLIPYSGSG